MQHTIPVNTMGPQGQVMASAVTSCVHCGFCLPACPTYDLLAEEMDSPRGRIILIKEVLEGGLDLEEALPYIDRCLGCVGCVPACPSGVSYGELLVTFRDYAEQRRQHTTAERTTRRFLLEILPHPKRFRAAARAGRLGRRFSSALPDQLASMLDLLPGGLPKSQPLPEYYPAWGARRARVALLAGCVQQALVPEINWATLRVLARNGVEVVIPRSQNCCGALSLHIGEMDHARGLASRNLDAFPVDVDAVITNAAGCGSAIKEYELLFEDGHRLEDARSLAARTQDVCYFLDHLGIEPPPPLPSPTRVAYHDACHLAHAQGIRGEPRRLLSAIENLTLLELADGELCCGSAGTYNLQQPAIAGQLGQHKAQAILNSNADLVATGNIGCMIQIQVHLQQLGQELPVYHTVQVLDMAYGAPAVPQL